MHSSDAELISAYLDGERRAVAVVDGWLEQSARSYRRRLSEDWEDALQEARLRVFRLLQDNRFRGEARLRTYLWRVVSHLCLNRIRAAEKWRWTDVEVLDRAGEPSLARPPEDMERLEWSELLLAVLEQATPRCRRLWRMVMAGLSYREMSERLEVSTGALRVRVRRCRIQALAAREKLLARRLTSHRGGR